MPYEALDAPDEAYPDHETASKAIAYLEQFADQDECLSRRRICEAAPAVLCAAVVLGCRRDRVAGKQWLNDPATPGKPLAVGRFGPGDTVRTDTFRYAEYRKNRGAGDLTGTMLYDHRSDPGENQNVVAKPPYADGASALSRELNRVKGRDSE